CATVFDHRLSWRRAASYADRILKGANPAELPVEQLDRFPLIINMMTARAIGLDLPPAHHAHRRGDRMARTVPGKILHLLRAVLGTKPCASSLPRRFRW